MPDAQELLEDIRSMDGKPQGQAVEALMAATDQTVHWVDDAWAQLVDDLGHRNDRTRAIAAQLLCNLAKSADEQRVLTALPALMAVTHDERIVTARHCLQSLWKLGVIGQPQRDAYRQALTARFDAASDEKNGTLTRADIVESLRRVYDETGDRAVHHTAERLIGTEVDAKYRRKYARAWRAGTTV